MNEVKINYSFRLPPDISIGAGTGSSFPNPSSQPTALLPRVLGSVNPFELPSNLYVSREGIVEGGWRNALTRFFVPYYAASQDRKVSEFFIQFFKDSFDQDPSVFDKAKITAMLSLAEQHIAHGKGWFSSQTSDTCRLEHYTLIARERLNAFEPHRSKEVLTEKCRADNQALAQKWEKLGFSKDAFWSCPDLVDLVFRSHLHRYINHPYYKHSIAMRPILTRIGGQVKVELHPHLFVEGRLTPWSELRTKLHVDAEERLYSIENGTKKLWMYLDQGLTQWDKNNFDNPRRLKQLDRAPLSSRVEIITTHAHPEDWHLGDRLLKGVHHSYFRIVPRQGFATSHPNAGLNDGSVYSLGWMARWRDFSFLGPLSTLQGKWFCPDSYEFLKEDLCITPVDITDEQLLKLVDIVKRRSKEEYPYHIITSNCVGVTADLLKEAGILDLKTKNHVMDMLYKFIFPKAARVPLNKVGTFLYSVTPNLLMIAVQRLANFLYSVVFVPIFSILGAWRTTISYEDEDGYRPDKSRIRVKTENRVKALYSNLFDMFSPNKLEFDLSKDIYKWQKTRADSYFEKHD